MSDEPSPAEVLKRLVEIGIYAPVGFLLRPEETVAELAEAGRKQLAFSRSLGRAAIQGIARGMRSESSSPSAPSRRPSESGASPSSAKPAALAPAKKPAAKKAAAKKTGAGKPVIKKSAAATKAMKAGANKAAAKKAAAKKKLSLIHI